MLDDLPEDLDAELARVEALAIGKQLSDSMGRMFEETWTPLFEEVRDHRGPWGVIGAFRGTAGLFRAYALKFEHEADQVEEAVRRDADQ